MRVMEKSYKANLLEIEKIGVKFAPERGGGFLTGIKYGSSDIMRDAYNRVHDWATQYTMHKKEWHGKFVEDWLYNAPKSKSTFNLTVNTFNLTETDLDAFIKWRETPQGFRPKGLQTEEELMLSFFGASRIGETYRGFPEGEKVIKTASLIPNVEFQHWIHNGYAIERVPYNYTYKKRQMFDKKKERNMAKKAKFTEKRAVLYNNKPLFFLKKYIYK